MLFLHRSAAKKLFYVIFWADVEQSHMHHYEGTNNLDCIRKMWTSVKHLDTK